MSLLGGTMKKIITLLLVLSLAFSLFAGGSAEKNETVKKDIITMTVLPL